MQTGKIFQLVRKEILQVIFYTLISTLFGQGAPCKTQRYKTSKCQRPQGKEAEFQAVISEERVVLKK